MYLDMTGVTPWNKGQKMNDAGAFWKKAYFVKRFLAVFLPTMKRRLRLAWSRRRKPRGALPGAQKISRANRSDERLARPRC